MCPLCFGTVALIVSSTGSAGAIGALVLTKLSRATPHAADRRECTDVTAPLPVVEPLPMRAKPPL